LVVLLQPKAVKVLLQHATLLKLLIRPSLVVRAGLLEHLVEDDPFWRASRLIALDCGDEIIVDGLSLDLPSFLLVVVLFGPPARAFVIIGWCLPFVALMAKENAETNARMMLWSGMCGSSVPCLEKRQAYYLTDSLDFRLQLLRSHELSRRM